jgi:hypothetical protein
LRSIVTVLLIIVASIANAQIRNIPEDAQVGTVRSQDTILIEQEGVLRALSPGVQVRDIENRIVPAAQLQQGEQIRYRVDPTGQVFRVWMLSEPEKAAIPAPPSPYPR